MQYDVILLVVDMKLYMTLEWWDHPGRDYETLNDEIAQVAWAEMHSDRLVAPSSKVVVIPGKPKKG